MAEPCRQELQRKAGNTVPQIQQVIAKAVRYLTQDHSQRTADPIEDLGRQLVDDFLTVQEAAPGRKGWGRCHSQQVGPPSCFSTLRTVPLERRNPIFLTFLCFFLASLEACVWLGTMGAATHNGRFPFVCDESEASNSFFLLTRSIAGEYSGLCSMIDAMLNCFSDDPTAASSSLNTFDDEAVLVFSEHIRSVPRHCCQMREAVPVS